MTIYTNVKNAYFNGFVNNDYKSTIKTIDFNNIKILNNSMYGMFGECHNLTSAANINKDVSNMASAFYNCKSMVNPPSIPSSVTNMFQTFKGCENLVNAPDLSRCNNLTDMYFTFWCCNNMTSTPVIPNSVTNMYGTFHMTDITEMPTIPNSVSDLSSAFWWCDLLTSSTSIPASVTKMAGTFYAAQNLEGNIFIESEQISDATNCFYATSKTKNVYIPYNYTNNVRTATYNSFITAGYDNAGTTNGVYLKDLNEMSENSFKYTTDTPAGGQAPDEAYTLKFSVIDPDTYSQVDEIYVDWNYVKDFTSLYNYSSGTEVHIYDIYQEPGSMEVGYYEWESMDVPVYSDVNCQTQVGVWSDYYGTGEYYIWVQDNYTEAGYTLGWIKDGYTAELLYTLPLYDENEVWKNSGSALKVDWGDGTRSIISGELTSSKLTHNYGVHNIYQISIDSFSGTMPRLCFDNNSEAREYLISIDTPLLDFIDKSSGINNIFKNCSKLESVCSGVFDNLTGITSARYAFAYCNSLYSLPTGIMNIDGCYDYTGCFAYSNNLINDDYFDTSVLEGITGNTIIFNDCFRKSDYPRYDVGTIQELWEVSYQTTISTTNTFVGNSYESADNWGDVPESWGGETNISVTVNASNDSNATVKINNVSGKTAIIKSGNRFSYEITPSTNTRIKLSSSELAKGGIDTSTTQTVSKTLSTYNQLGLFPTTGNHMPMIIYNLDNELFLSVPSGSSAYTSGNSNPSVYKYDSTRNRWFAALGIPEDPDVTEGTYSDCGGIFKLNNKYFAVMKNFKVYNSTDGYNWSEVSGVSGLTSSSFPDKVMSNGSIAVVKPYSGKLLWTTDGKTYTQCSGGSSGWIYCTKYLNGYFWFVQGSGLYRSSDGKSFTKVATLTKDFYYFSYAGGKYFAQPYSGDTKLYYSTNGSSWSSVDMGSTIAGVFYDNNKYVATITYGNGIFTSSDGINWSAKDTTKSYIQNGKDAIQIDNGIVLSGSYDYVMQYDLAFY